MTISPRVWNFPTFKISEQLFRVPGQAVAGGFTSGGAQFVEPEPGGFGVLDIKPSLITSEWNYPLASWLMSKTNGHIFRVRLAPTPQIAYSRNRGQSAVLWDEDLLWSNLQAWEGDFSGVYALDALEGSTEVVIDLTGVGAVVQVGHVIGHETHSCYMVDEIEYEDDVATITVNPPLRRDVTTGDSAPLRPWFTGRIGNPGDFLSVYKASDVGHIQLEKITLHEAIVP